MVRQCAWCLRLIDSAGGRVSQLPLPKLYEASHGMCGICGTRWMEQVLGSLGEPRMPLQQSEEFVESAGLASQEEQLQRSLPAVVELTLEPELRVQGCVDDPMHVL